MNAAGLRSDAALEMIDVGAEYLSQIALYSASENPVTSDPFVDPTAHRHDRQLAEVIVNYHGFELVPQHEHIAIKPQLQITTAVSGKSDPFHMVPKDRQARRFLRFVRQIGGNDSATRLHHLPIPHVDQPPPAARSVIREGRHLSGGCWIAWGRHHRKTPSSSVVLACGEQGQDEIGQDRNDAPRDHDEVGAIDLIEEELDHDHRHRRGEPHHGAPRRHQP
jgi:hypothetical protein